MAGVIGVPAGRGMDELSRVLWALDHQPVGQRVAEHGTGWFARDAGYNLRRPANWNDVIGVTAVTSFLPRLRRGATWWPEPCDGALVIAALIAIATVMAAALLHGGFAPRYLMSAMPSLLFGAALWARWYASVDRMPVIGMFAIMAAAMVGVALRLGDQQDGRRAAFV